MTNRSWEDVYDELSYHSGQQGLLFDNVDFVEEYLDYRYDRECHYSKTIGEFAKEHPYGKYAVTTNGHITSIIDGTIYDTFDPSKKVMRCAWRIR